MAALNTAQINDTTGCADWMDATSGPRPKDFGHFGDDVSVTPGGLVAVGSLLTNSAFLFVINETSPGNASLVLLADLIPAAGGPEIPSSNYGTLIDKVPD